MNNEDSKKEILKIIKEFEQKSVRFSFRDDDNKQCFDGIAVTIKRDDFKKLHDDGINIGKMGDSFKEYLMFIKLLETYDIPYEEHTYEISW